jgi:hypothetical protein
MVYHFGYFHVMCCMCGDSDSYRRKTCIFDYSLRLNFSHKKHFATKIPLVACDKLIANDKGYCMKEKVNKYISSFDSIVYVLLHATKMQLFWSQLRETDVHFINLKILEVWYMLKWPFLLTNSMITFNYNPPKKMAWKSFFTHK